MTPIRPINRTANYVLLRFTFAMTRARMQRREVWGGENYKRIIPIEWRG